MLISLNSIANENKFEVSNIELENSGKIIIANNGKYTSKDGKFEVVANKFIYNKEESLLSIFEGEAKNKFDGLKIKFDKSIYNENNLTLSSEGDIAIEDKSKNLLIKSDEIIFDRKNDFLLIKGNVKVHETAKDYTYESEKITIDRKYDIIKSETKSKIQDRFKNILSVNKFELNKGIIKIKDLNFKDLEDNSFNLDSAQIDTASNELLGKDILVNLSNLTFDKENEPRIKGKAISYNDNITEITKGVFTPCKKTEKCPPWQLSAEKIKHNKTKKTISYENVWLKIYDKPVVYLPKFFHPDPTVKRQSGFLMPSFKTSLNNNTFLSVPYYKALSHDKDITFTPRFYAKDQLLIQTEYRTISKNSTSNTDFSIFNEKGEYFKSHIFHNSNKNLDFVNFNKSNLNLRLETTSNDTYLKGNNLTSPLISNYDILESSLQLDLPPKIQKSKLILFLLKI
jgi:LPS-assembly protein